MSLPIAPSGEPARAPSRARRAVRVMPPRVPNPAPAGAATTFARVTGRALWRLGVRGGDHVLLRRIRVAPDGALASVADPAGRSALWRVRHDRDALALLAASEEPVARTAPWPEVQGVVVAVLRKGEPRPLRRRPPRFAVDGAAGAE